MKLTRRAFLQSSAILAASASWSPSARAGNDEISSLIQDGMSRSHTVGVSVCAVRGRESIWEAGFGWADIESKRIRTAQTLQNIASITKTITATAIMQQLEQGRLDLDTDINDYLPFAVHNPDHPEIPITPRTLLTHTSSTRDGAAYEASYACGDPTTPLREWIESCLTPAGVNFDEGRNFIPRAPGTTHVYSNTGFGVLGVIVEELSGMSFEEYTRKHVLKPTGMHASGWYLRDVDVENHATPYQYLDEGDSVSRGLGRGESPESGHAPLCLYSFTNLPDGLLRTNVSDYGRFLGECIAALQHDDSVLLRRETFEYMLQRYATPRNRDSLEAMQGLCWYGSPDPEGRTVWGHSGGDPGVSTLMLLDPKDGVGAAIFANGPGGDYFAPTLYALLDLARSA